MKPLIAIAALFLCVTGLAQNKVAEARQVKQYTIEQFYKNTHYGDGAFSTDSGYMTLAALAFHPEEFVSGVDLFGVANWLRT